MESLIKLAEEGKIEKTGAKPKLPIKIEGITSNMLDVYRIPLEYLYYNNDNGRIATRTINETAKPVSDKISPAYNEMIAQFIKEDDPNALKKQKNQFKLMDSKCLVTFWMMDGSLMVIGVTQHFVKFNVRREKHIILKQ